MGNKLNLLQVVQQTMRTKENVLNGFYSYNRDGQLEAHDEGSFFQVV
jgi:hypothetical protein